MNINVDETTDFDEVWNGGYAIYTHSEFDGWTKQEYFKYEGELWKSLKDGIMFTTVLLFLDLKIIV